MEQQQKPMDLSKTTPIICSSCDANIFQEVLILRKESRFMSGLPYDRTGPIPVYACIECSTIVEDTIPLPLKELLKSEIGE
jgi:DNA-directed RNA polymerase subunit RPC12/RpoP